MRSAYNKLSRSPGPLPHVAGIWLRAPQQLVQRGFLVLKDLKIKAKSLLRRPNTLPIGFLTLKFKLFEVYNSAPLFSFGLAQFQVKSLHISSWS